MDEELNALFKELADSECDRTAEEYVDFYVETCSSLLAINSDMVDWRIISVKACATDFLRKEWSNPNEVASGNVDDKDDDDANSKDVEVVKIGTGEALIMLDRLVNLKDLLKEERKSLVAMKDKLEKIRVLKKRQNHINDYFMLE